MTTRAKPYHFQTNWLLATSLHATWQAIGRPEGWQQWGAGLEHLNIIKRTPNIIGSKLAGTWYSKPGYRLRLNLTITDCQPHKAIYFDSAGDLVGHGSFQLAGDEHHTTIQIIWDVATQKAWMNLLAPVLKPLFIKNHNAHMQKSHIALQTRLAKTPPPV